MKRYRKESLLDASCKRPTLLERSKLKYITEALKESLLSMNNYFRNVCAGASKNRSYAQQNKGNIKKGFQVKSGNLSERRRNNICEKFDSTESESGFSKRETKRQRKV